MIAEWALLVVVLLITIADIFVFFMRKAKLRENHDFHLMENEMKEWLNRKRIVDRLPHLLQRYYLERSADAKSELANFSIGLGQEGFKNEFLNILKKLDYPYYVDFWEILKSSGIKVRPALISGRDGFIVEWKEDNEISDFCIEIPEEWKNMLRDPLESVCYWLYEQYELEDIDLEQLVSRYDTRSGMVIV